MERNKRTVFAVLIATIIVVAVFSSFALNLFNRDKYQIGLPDLSEDVGTEAPGQNDGLANRYVRVDITPETVQRVIEKTLSRPQSYARKVQIELWAEEETPSVTTAEVWVDGGWTGSVVTSDRGLVQYNLAGDGTRWIWYEGDETAVSFPAEQNISDLVQRIPTYEDVLKLSKRDITATGYENYAGVDCIYVEVEQKELGSQERYWIAVSDGLLVAAERIKEEQVVYRMTALSTESPAPLSYRFELPDGTPLHIRESS